MIYHGLELNDEPTMMGMVASCGTVDHDGNKEQS